MSKKCLLAVAATLAVLVAPTGVSAWGGYHAQYTHVGPNGVYHASTTRAYGNNGGSASHYTYGGYHSNYGGYGGGGGGYHYNYHYTPSYGGGNSYHYSYVR